MSKLNNIIIESMKSCLIFLIINLELVVSNGNEMLNSNNVHELLKDVPMTNLYYKINSVNDKHFDVIPKQRGGKKHIRASRNNPDNDKFDTLINTEDPTEDLHENNKKSRHYSKAGGGFDYYVNKEDTNSRDRPDLYYTIQEISQENAKKKKYSKEIKSFFDYHTSDGYLENVIRQYKDYIDKKTHSNDVLEGDHETDNLADVSDYTDGLKSSHFDCSDNDTSVEQKTYESSKIYVIHPKDIQALLNNNSPKNIQKISNKDIPEYVQYNDKLENVLKLFNNDNSELLNKHIAQTQTKHTINIPKPSILEPLLQFQEKSHYEDNDKYEVRHESYNRQYDRISNTKPNKIYVKNKERSNKINSIYQKAEVKLKDINWLDILNKTIPVETDSDSSEDLTYRESSKTSSRLLESLKYKDKNKDITKLLENLLKYNYESRNQDLKNIDVLDKPILAKESDHKNRNISSKAYVLDKHKFLNTIPTVSKDPNNKNTLLLLNDINHLLQNTPISRKSQQDAFPKLIDILRDAYLLTVKVKNFIKDVHRLQNEYYGNDEETSEELFKYYEFNPPRDYHDISVEELAAMLVQDIHLYMKRIYSPSARHEIIKKLGVINIKVKYVKKDLMESLEQSIRKRKEMSEKIKSNKQLKEHFRKNWSDSISDLFGGAKLTKSHRKQNQEILPKELVPKELIPQELVPQEGTLLEEAPQTKANETKPTENPVNIQENQAPNDEKSKDLGNQAILAQENENPKVEKEEVSPTENKPMGEPNHDETDKVEGKDTKVATVDAVPTINEDKIESKLEITKAVKDKDNSVEITTEKGTTKGSTKKYRLPVYGLFDYWTYKKTVVEDECPQGTAKLQNVCIRLPPH